MASADPDMDAIRERALSRWIPPGEWSPELGAAVEEMMTSTGPGCIEEVVETVGHVPVEVVPVGTQSVIVARRGDADVKADESLPTL